MIAYSSIFRYSIEVDGCTHKLTIPEVTLKDGGAVSYSIEKLSNEATLTVDGTFIFITLYKSFGCMVGLFKIKIFSQKQSNSQTF